MSSGKWRIILAVAVGSALLGAVVTIIALDDSNERTNTKSMSRKTDGIQPPKPEWEKPASAAKTDALTQETGRLRSPTTAKSQRPSLENLPQVNQIREEAGRDPHSTPQSLLAFAEELSVSMQGAFSNRETRFDVSRQLIACARDGQAKGSAQAARALCLYNLERLKERFPEELAASYHSLLAELPEDLIFVAGVTKQGGEK